METFAAYTAQTDYEVGRVLDVLQQVGQADNTLVFWEIGDNGASMEGTLNGVFNEMTSLNGQPEDTVYILQHIDEIGGPKSYNHFPVGWAWAMNTPFQWGKQVASHFGGTRNPLVVSWPNRIKDKGGLRTQFHHAIDIVPTILEAAGIQAAQQRAAPSRFLSTTRRSAKAASKRRFWRAIRPMRPSTSAWIPARRSATITHPPTPSPEL